uniref:15-cis-phytoene synthase n=1 Tax=Timema monikensis TaxID=170555 RepID=A0A7R9E4P1_9NEOP|nr:unnamed protein product [Timema monikensis]
MLKVLGIRKVIFGGSLRIFGWKGSENHFGKVTLSRPDRDLNNLIIGSLVYCEQQSPNWVYEPTLFVRQFDYENFLCTLLLPHNCRTSAFAIRAFNIEVARVQDQISDARIGQMRLKFWEDVIESIFQNKAHKHPVALELHRASKKHKLSKRYLKRLITARSNQLNISSFPDLEAMEVYSEGSVSSVNYLLLETAGVENVHADHAASHLGKAQGISNILRSVFHNIQHNVVALPQDVLLKHSVSHETVLRAECNKALIEVFFDIANRAKQHLAKARSLSKQVPKPAHILFLPATAVDAYLERLRRTHFNAFDPSLQQRNTLLPLFLYWNKFISKY